MFGAIFAAAAPGTSAGLPDASPAGVCVPPGVESFGVCVTPGPCAVAGSAYNNVASCPTQEGRALCYEVTTGPYSDAGCAAPAEIVTASASAFPEKCVGDKFSRWCVTFESDGSVCVSREGGDFPIRKCVPTRQTTAAALDVSGALEECNATTVKLACVGYSDGKATVCYQPSPGNLDPPPPVCKSVGPAVKPMTGCVGGDIACWSVSGSGATLCYTTPGHMDPPPPVCYSVGLDAGTGTSTAAASAASYCTPETLESTYACFDTQGKCVTVSLKVPPTRTVCLDAAVEPIGSFCVDGLLDNTYVCYDAAGPCVTFAVKTSPVQTCLPAAQAASPTIDTPCYAMDAGVAEVRGCSTRPVHVNPVDTCVQEPAGRFYVCTQADAATGACVSVGATYIRIEPLGACVGPGATSPTAGAASADPCVGAREEARVCFYSDDSGQNCTSADLRAAGAASACWNFIARTASACADADVAADERCADLKDLLTSSAGVYVTEQVCTPQAVKTARVCWTTIGFCLAARADGEARETCLLPEESAGAGSAAAIPDRVCKSDKWGGEMYRVCVDTRTPCASVELGFDPVVDTCLHPVTSTAASGAGGVSKCTPTLIPMSPHPQTCVRYAGVNDFCVTSTGTAGQDVEFCVVYVGPVIW